MLALLRRWFGGRGGSEHKNPVLPPAAFENESPLAEAADKSAVFTIFMLMVIWGVCALLLTLVTSRQPMEYDLVPGQRAPRTILAAMDFSYEDRAETRRLRQEAVTGAPVFYRLSAAANERILAAYEQFFHELESSAAAAAPAAPDVGQLAPELRKQLVAELGNASRRTAFENALQALLNQGILSTSAASSSTSGQRLRVIDLSGRERLAKGLVEQPTVRFAAMQLARQWFSERPGDTAARELLKQWVAVNEALLGDGNLVYDSVRTESERKFLSDRVERVQLEIRKNQPVIRKNSVVDSAAVERLALYQQQLASQHDQFRYGWDVLSNMFWSLILLAFAGFYLYHIHPEVVHSNRKIGVIALTVIFSLFMNFFAMEIYGFSVAEINSLPQALSVSALPLALVSVLLAVMLGYRVALCGGFFVAAVTALMFDQSLDFALRGAVVSSLAALAVRNATNYRSYFLRTLLTVFPLVWVINGNVLERADNWRMVGEWVAWGGLIAFLNALLTAILALLLTFLFELVFNVTTNMALMVLCDYNHPLLERLKREAPGTFFHSMMVATLAEDAAGAIGANSLKAKAGALFHDIGKLVDPQYFTENNLNSTNQHLSLAPQVSSNIIRGHVANGLALAHQYKLCRPVRDAIEQHHGTDLVQFFYQKAKARGEQVDEKNFRYGGSLPVDKEVAIVSLADACEAACRSIDTPTKEQIDRVVSQIILRRFQEGQLSQAGMTLAELEKVHRSFVNTLMSMKHGRISYHKDIAQHGSPLPVAGGQPGESAPAAAEKTDPAGR